MITLHIFTEEISIKKVLDIILPQLISSEMKFRIYPHQGKDDLKKAIKSTVPLISKNLNSRIIIAIDNDNNDCLKLKNEINDLVDISCPYKIRIIIQELEAWFLGDLTVVEKAFSKFKASTYSNKTEFRNVDTIINPSYKLLKIIPDYSKSSFLPKQSTAEKIAKYLNIYKNKSDSFNQFIGAVKELCSV
ncbi:MAG TPA: hypothetical protein PK006_07900 [Saprospiraceae bacterium]|nr:hypothetical protein [Saprospiraceae bacterium]